LKQVESGDVLDLTTSGHLLPASTNPTLLGGTLTAEDSNVVTSTSQVWVSTTKKFVRTTLFDNFWLGRR
jgi:hypothetical protein